MAAGKFVAYYRVSTERQGRSGLGLVAQKEAVRTYLNGGNWQLVAEVTEVESGKRNDRPELATAMRLCRIHGATLIIAKLDRLSRNAAFLLNLRDSGTKFVAADMPDANSLTIGVLAVVAQHEREMISARTKAALSAAKARGRQLGGDRGNLARVAAEGRVASLEARRTKAARRQADVGPMVAELHASGASLRQIAATLNDRGITTAWGKQWAAQQVARVLSGQLPVARG